jgi:hypothetical protein
LLEHLRAHHGHLHAPLRLRARLHVRYLPRHPLRKNLARVLLVWCALLALRALARPTSARIRHVCGQPWRRGCMETTKGRHEGKHDKYAHR